VDGRLSSRVPASDHCYREIANEPRLAKGRVKNAPADKTIKTWNFEPPIFCAGGNDDGLRYDFTAIR
jgi:hypothetical protein